MAAAKGVLMDSWEESEEDPGALGLEDLQSCLDELEKTGVHFAAGPASRGAHILQAETCMATDEMWAIHHLIEAHVPTHRLKALMVYEKSLLASAPTLDYSLEDLLRDDDVPNELLLYGVGGQCPSANRAECADALLRKLEEMPEEWTLVQLTPHHNPDESVNINPQKYHTNPLYVTVLSCGKPSQPRPYCVSVDAPRDKEANVVHLVQEMHSIVSDNKEGMVKIKQRWESHGDADLDRYFQWRQDISARLKQLVKEMQDSWLRARRCLLLGKYVDKTVDGQVQGHLRDFFKQQKHEPDWKTALIVEALVKGAHHLGLMELKEVMQELFPEPKLKDLRKDLARLILNVNTKLDLAQQKKHPVILIVDDILDKLPWEQMDVIVREPVSRLLSFHLAYMLFKVHEASIEGGHKIVRDLEKGGCIVNPDMDLAKMEKRITSFCDYWTPKWRIVSGRKPTEEEFEDMVTKTNVFVYNGHGSGAQHYDPGKISRLRINAVVLLFGCGSTRLNRLSPRVEMYGTYQVYMLACSPCIVGMLWEVTDQDTDFLSTELISVWVPSKVNVAWTFLDKQFWRKGIYIDFHKTEIKPVKHQPHEPELLRALCKARECNNIVSYITRAACVARGIPVRYCPA